MTIPIKKDIVDEIATMSLNEIAEWIVNLYQDKKWLMTENDKYRAAKGYDICKAIKEAE